MCIDVSDQPPVPDETTNVDMKKLICQHIARSVFFDMFEEDPVDMNEVYRDLETLRLNDDEEKLSYERLLLGYTEAGPSMAYTYPTEEIIFTITTHSIVDYAFACLTRKRDTQELMLNYISDPRNINAALDFPIEGYITARFICRMTMDICSIVAMAEEPATAIISPEYNIEDLYLQRRAFNKPGN